LTSPGKAATQGPRSKPGPATKDKQGKAEIVVKAEESIKRFQAQATKRRRPKQSSNSDNSQGGRASLAYGRFLA